MSQTISVTQSARQTLIVSVTRDLATCQRLRREVFMQEQGVSEAEEIDGRDGEAVHFLIHRDGAAIGTARAFVADGVIKIGRVCIQRPARGIDAGRVLMLGVMDWAREQGLALAQLDAQLAVMGFYERLGFAASGPIFDDAGIPHRHMARALACRP